MGKFQIKRTDYAWLIQEFRFGFFWWTVSKFGSRREAHKHARILREAGHHEVPHLKTLRFQYDIDDPFATPFTDYAVEWWKDRYPEALLFSHKDEPKVANAPTCPKCLLFMLPVNISVLSGDHYVCPLFRCKQCGYEIASENIPR